MMIGLKTISIALLLLTAAESAFAGPFSHLREGREARAARQQRGTVQEERQQAQGDPRSGLPPGAQVAPGVNAPVAAPGGGIFLRQPDQVRKFGPRMSVEERQRLRRQINEAGQDIYAPRK
ncbi:MAG TPA: hypothetical protein VK832_13035 [Burkholderiaceae bacterium]|nr:hypothetical protein [Burkholderiaceae bacterium]